MFVFNWGCGRCWSLVLCALVLSGCILDSPDGGGMRRQRRLAGDESWRWDGVPEHWGQKKTFDSTAAAAAQDKVVWVDGQRHIVLDVPAPEIWRVPQVQTLVLGAQITGPNTSLFFPRWEIDLGVGGARSTFVIDAQRLQQITAPAATTRASFFLENFGGSFTAANVVAQVAAYEADGNSGTAPAQYTQFFLAPNGASTSLAIPAAAVRFRILANGGDEFAATTTYSVRQFGTAVDIFSGPAMATAHTAGDFMPLPAASTTLVVTVAGPNAVSTTILYELEL